uniref:COP9 signalosome complex subunit 3 N-terminal helical repeats domain-containing protein n=1 Tax=Phaeomonas parva TaxID=124430 RepID=A0A7S1XUH7_9STRA|eukprot:CAMPEP_0118867476 /NCGR_PEP_ID=MMETSP1163-20130328/11064_1 /TAXON_ID=124430 /ORGANISM="Phaeomonas parva, Strain CCMP2877" /LENGTH=472 /DNA_ID=CAMNT_0006801893 /DNA_START=80 /DNA_END=1498 /DNA_ORIENTATION=+
MAATALESAVRRIVEAGTEADALKRLNADLRGSRASLEQQLVEELQGDEPSTAAIEASLAALDFGRHGVGAAHIFAAFAAAVTTPHMALFFDAAATYVLAADVAQLRTVDAVPFVAVLRRVVDVACECKRELEAARLLLAALPKLQPRPHCLTPLHPAILRLCLLGRCHHIAARLIDNDAIFEVAPDVDLTPADYLCYFYYGGTALAGLLRFRDAAEMLRLCVAMPSQGEVSAIAVAAYRRLLIVNLLASREPATLPKHVNRMVADALREASKPYKALEDVFTAPEATVAGLEEAIAARADVLEVDTNLGLANQLPKALRRKKLASLSRSYMTIPLGKATAALELDSAEATKRLTMELVDERQIRLGTKVDEERAVLSFMAEADAGGGHGRFSVAALQGTMERVLALSERIKSLDVAINVDPKYLQQKTRSERFGHAAGFGGMGIEAGAGGQSSSDILDVLDGGQQIEEVLG